MRPTIVSLLALLAGCGAESAGQADVPTSVVVVCAKTCDPAVRRELFRTWANRALALPGSRFQVWRSGGRLDFAVEVPTRWPAPVTASRADFLARGEVGAAADAGPASSGPRDATGEIEVAVLGAPELERAIRAGLAAPAPALTSVVCDRSSSTLGVSCQASTLLQAAIAWLEHGGVLEGASFGVLVPGQGYDSARRIAERRIDGHAVGERIEQALDAIDGVADAVAHDRGPAGSAIAETIRLAVDDLGHRRGSCALVVLSDLRQYTPGRWNFERQVPRTAAFSGWLSREGLSVDLRGIDVSACGTHHMRGKGAGSFDARMAHDVVELWSEVFRGEGATDARISSDCSATIDDDAASR